MILNLIIYGTYMSIKKRKNMFPKVIKDLELKKNILSKDRVNLKFNEDKDIETNILD